MATTLIMGHLSMFLPSQHSGNSRRCLFKKPHNAKPILKCSFEPQVRAHSTASIETKPTDPIAVEKELVSGSNILACPICYETLSLIGYSVLYIGCASGSILKCNTCKKTYSGKETHLELTVGSGERRYGEALPIASELFRNPLVSFLYERGWRQNFEVGGFPGVEEEFELIKTYLKPVLGGNIVDASCGSGLFSRIFAKSGLFSLVVALDYSENMLWQCHEFVKQEENFPKENLILVRADIFRLPFASHSVDAIHGGAAIHCWSSPLGAVAEISRVLRPGGVFVGTTFILDEPSYLVPLLRTLRQSVTQLLGSQIFLNESELEDICTACGLVGFKSTRNRQFVMFSATKAS